jgi:hypothetical protein
MLLSPWRLSRRAVGSGRGLTLTALLVLAGCAIDDRGVVERRWFASDTAWIVTLEAWGVHVTTNRFDAGITIGRSQRLYGFARAPIDDQELDRRTAPLGFLMNGGAALREVTNPRARPELADLGDPLMIVRRDAGVILRCDTTDAGVTIGARTHAAIHLPLERDGVLVLAVDPDVPESIQMHWKGAIP